MDTFYKWLIGDMGTPGDYMYQAIHLYSLLAVAAVTVLCIVLQLCLRRQPRHKDTLLKVVCVIHIAFEIGWRLIYLFVKKSSWVDLWPCYPCNLGGILIPLIGLLNWKTGKKLFYLFGLVGAVLTFAMPDGIFSTDVFVFPLLKSVMQHTGILLIPILEYISGSYRPSLRDYGWIVAGCSIHVLNCEGIVRLMGLTGDYIFFRSGLPFVIPGVPQFITMSVFALLVLAVLTFLCDVKGSVNFWRSFKKCKV